MSSSPGVGADVDELTVPRAAISSMIKEMLPSVRLANDARELLVKCCSDFIHLVSSEANEMCGAAKKATISPEHVIGALENLGFTAYVSDVKDVLAEYKTEALRRRKGKVAWRLANAGVPEEELLRQQQELFAAARQQQTQLAQQEWLQMQQAAQQALMMAAAASSDVRLQASGSSFQDEDDDVDLDQI